MPLYEYRCKECGRRYTLLVGVTAEKPKRACPRCGSPKATKLISRIAPIVREDDFDDDWEGEDYDDAGDDYDDDFDD
jgi:putative FmdB family regulatory protein